MLKNFHHVSRHGVKSRLGMTLVEMMIAVGLSVIVLASLMVVAVFVNTSFKSISNYADLDKSSRNALDVMGRDIRGAAHLTSSLSLTNSITMTNLDGSSFSYTWNTNSTFKRTFTTAGGTASTTVLLTNCDYLCFNFYQRNPTTNLAFVTASTVSQAKLINVDWRCSRFVSGSRHSTESVQTAQIVIRN